MRCQPGSASAHEHHCPFHLCLVIMYSNAGQMLIQQLWKTWPKGQLRVQRDRPGPGDQSLLAGWMPCHGWPGPIVRHTSLPVVTWKETTNSCINLHQSPDFQRLLVDYFASPWPRLATPLRQSLRSCYKGNGAQRDMSLALLTMVGARPSRAVESSKRFL